MRSGYTRHAQIDNYDYLINIGGATEKDRVTVMILENEVATAF